MLRLLTTAITTVILSISTISASDRTDEQANEAKSQVAKATSVFSRATSELKKGERITYPYVVPFPDGYDPSLKYAVPVARQYEADGTWTDLYKGGHLRIYKADGYSGGVSGGCGKACRARHGLGRSRNDLLAEWYINKYQASAMISPSNDSASEYRPGGPDSND